RFALRPFKAFAADSQRVDRDIVSLGVEVGRVVLAGPGVEEIPPDLFLTGVVELNDRAVSSIDLSIEDFLVPVIQLGRIRRTILQSDVGEAELSGQLSNRRELTAFAVLDHFNV